MERKRQTSVLALPPISSKPAVQVYKKEFNYWDRGHGLEDQLPPRRTRADRIKESKSMELGEEEELDPNNL